MRIVREPSADGMNILWRGTCGWCSAIIEAWRSELTTIVILDEKEKEEGYGQCPCCDTSVKFFPMG